MKKPSGGGGGFVEDDRRVTTALPLESVSAKKCSANTGKRVRKIRPKEKAEEKRELRNNLKKRRPSPTGGNSVNYFLRKP